MSNPGYVPLHVHSFCSFLDAASSVRDLVAAAARYEMPALALTDRDGLYGAVEFYLACRDAGVRPILGAEIELADRAHLVLLAETGDGYRNLCRLLTRTHIRQEGKLSREALARSSDGLVALSGCRRGGVARALLAGRESEAEGIARREADLFPGAYCIELQSALPSDRDLNRRLVSLARRLDLPVIATPNSHYTAPEERVVYETLASIRTRTLLRQPHPDKKRTGRYHLKSPRFMEEAFAGIPEALRTSREIAERCRVELPIGRTRFPDFPLPSGECPATFLRRLCLRGVVERYGKMTDTLRARLDHELKTIDELGYTPYFLIVRDIVREAGERGIPVVGRGSAADSLVCYVLRISNICPLTYRLDFERFLNRERVKATGLADIDLDIAWDRRDELVDYVYRKYGFAHVATIATIIPFHARSALAEVGKVFGLPDREVRRMTRHLPYIGADQIHRAARTVAECRDLPVSEEPYRTILALAAAIEGYPRHLGMHPCGIVISREPLTDLVPLERSAKGPVITQFTMDPIELLGLVKMDLLGQAGLAVIRETVAAVRAAGGADLDPEAFPLDDPATWDLISRGATRGCFHIESPAMVSLLRMVRCRDIEGLIACESIIRPGAANEGKKLSFARRYQGMEEATCPDPALAPLLGDTYGLMVYEEQILRVAHHFAGMDLGRADLLRRALVKQHDPREVARYEDEFRDGAIRRGHATGTVEAVWNFVREFCGYMFNKAHSGAYAMLAYQCAYLKRRWPAPFLAAVLNSRRGFYAPIVYVLEGMRLGLRFRAPDINRSGLLFRADGSEVIVPLTALRNLSPEGALTVVREREARGPFDSVADVARRCPIRYADGVVLIRAGALDSLDFRRSRMMWEWKQARSDGASANDLFSSVRRAAPPAETLAEPDREERLRREFEALGFLCSCHPLDLYGVATGRRDSVALSELHRHAGTTVRVRGMIVATRIHPTQKGDLMKFITISDRTDMAEAVLFPAVYRRYGHLTAAHPVVELAATVEPFENGNGFTLNAQTVRPLGQPAEPHHLQRNLAPMACR